MKSPMVRGSLALLIGLALAVAGLTPRLVAPPAVLALDETITTCDWDTFSATLAAVQADGGGTIALDCDGTIVFTGHHTITTDVTITGNGVVIFDGNESTRFFTVNADAHLTLKGLTLQNGSEEDSLESGGAIYNTGNLEIIACMFTFNQAPSGGAIYNNSGTVVVSASTFNENFALGGGAIGNDLGTVEVTASSFNDNAALSGGAIDSLGTLTVTASSFNGNVAIGGGGAIDNAGAIAEVSVSTFTGNSSISGGGAIDNKGSMEVTASTFSGNNAELRGAVFHNAGTLNVSSSIMADSTMGGNCFGLIASGGSNLDDDGTCGFGVDEEGDANLAMLADNGGPTLTMLPQIPSDALDAADCADTTAVDQRGAARPATGCDIGAVEVGAAIPVQIVAAYGFGVEGSPSTVTAIAYGPNNANLSYTFDCDNDPGYERPGDGSGTSGSGECTFPDNGVFTVGVKVCDGNDVINCDTASATTTVSNLNPVIEGVVDNGPVDEGSPVTITVTTSDPAGANDPLQYAFDCDNDGNDYETAGNGNQGSCTFGDNGSFTVGVQVSDDDGGTTTTTKTVEALNVAPTVNQPSVNPSPSNERQGVVASATFADPGALDTHTCTVDYGDGSDPQDGAVEAGACTGPEHIYLDDDPSGTPSDDYSVTITVTDDDSAAGNASALHTVNNIAPTIDAITTNAPVPQGQPATVTVIASDPGGVNDPLTYAFDCDGDQIYEVDAQPTNVYDCLLDPSAASTTINVLIEDDDGGNDTGSVTVSQTATVCASYATGAISGPTAGGGCPPGSTALSLPLAVPMTICINPYTAGTLRWSPAGSCSPIERAHIVPDDGPLPYCQNIYTGDLRYAWNGQCSANEQAGVIPG